MSKPVVLFFDPVCPKPYTYHTLDHEGMGGTEATCLRVARALSDRFKCIIAQRNRTDMVEDQGVEFRPLESILERVDRVITLRDAGFYKKNKEAYPNAKHYLWMHDVVSGDYKDHFKIHLTNQPVDMISVSDWHKGQIYHALEPIVGGNNLRITRIYNLVSEHCAKNGADYDPYKLVFFSSPHKGLNHVLEIFNQLKVKEPNFKLYISNPGYLESAKDLPEGVINLGVLPHKEAIEHVRSALCVFYPQLVFPETFGLVYVEANAVGTPVIACSIGSASEVLRHPAQIVKPDAEEIINRVIKWSKGERPIVKLEHEFTTQGSKQQWVKLLSQ